MTSIKTHENKNPSIPKLSMDSLTSKIFGSNSIAISDKKPVMLYRSSLSIHTVGNGPRIDLDTYARISFQSSYKAYLINPKFYNA